MTLDPLSGRPRGDPLVAVRLGLATAGAQCASGLLEAAVVRLQHDRVGPTPWDAAAGVLGYALPFGAAATVLSLRDRAPGRTPLRLVEALALSLAAHAVSAVAWAARHGASGGPAFLPDEDAQARLTLLEGYVSFMIPGLLGFAVGLLLIVRTAGRRHVGLCLALPTVAAALVSMALLPGGSAPWSGSLARHAAVITLALPLLERALHAATRREEA